MSVKIDALPTVQQSADWIPVSERLPDEDDVDVLVTNDAGGMKNIEIDSMGSYEDGSGRFWWYSQNPIAWMPLPKPYEPQ